MSYYEEKKRLNHYLEERIKQKSGKITREVLVYEGTKTFAVGEKAIENRIKMLEELGKIEEIGGVLAWVH